MSVIGRSDKNRTLTKEEHDWFWDLMRLREDDVDISFPDAWKYFDSGLSAQEAFNLVKKANENNGIH